MAYLLDANAFIEAKKRYYGLDFCPAYWDWIDREHAAGRVFSIEKIADEIAAGGDDLSRWTAARSGMFLPLDSKVVASLAKVAEWVKGEKYTQAAIHAFLQDADYYLVSHAHAYGHIVVTEEIPSIGLKEVKIPNACIGVGVKFMTPFQMLGKERARFVLAASPAPAGAGAP